MARITRVQRAQQRYKMVPVIDPETGQQKRTPVMGRNGQQKTNKHGRPVFMDVTVADKSQPLPNRNCGKCGTEIKVGQPYKHISPRSGPYGGRTMYRCAACPDWNVWEYSSSLSARVAEIGHDFWGDQDNWSSTDDVQESLNSAAERIREIAEEKREGASNIEEGFGHETSQSQELNETADSLDSWADEVEGVDLPDYPEPEEQDCDDCEGSGEVDNPDFLELEASQEDINKKLAEARKHLTLLQAMPIDAQLPAKIKAQQEVIRKLIKDQETVDAALLETDAQVSCETCDGSGRIEPEEPTAEQIDEWRSEVESNCSIVDECPV